MNIHTAANAESQSIAVATTDPLKNPDKDNGATATRAKCAAKAYLAISLCT